MGQTNMQRLWGRAPRGERVIGTAPAGHWHATTLIAALDLSGVRCSMLADGAVNRDVFESFVARALCPQLRKGDIVILDNLSRATGAGGRGSRSGLTTPSFGSCRRTRRT